MTRTEAMALHLYNRLVEGGHTHTVAWQESLGSLSPQVLSTMTLSQQIEFYEAAAEKIAAQLRDPEALAEPVFNPDSSTVVFFDIDGVISPLPEQTPYRCLVDDQIYVQPMMPVRRQVIDWLHQPRNANLLWSSSWCSQALTLTESMGAGPVETVIDERNTLNKKDSVCTWLADNPHVTRVIICEDEPYRLTDDEISKLSLNTVDYIDTDPYQGLTDEQLAEIGRFVMKS